MSATEQTPLLADEHNEDHVEEGTVVQEEDARLPANSYFRRPLRILTIVTTILSGIGFLLFAAIYVYLEVGPFETRWNVQEGAKSTLIVLLVTTIISTLNIFLDFPIFIITLANAILAFFAMVYTVNLFDYGFPSRDMCSRYGPDWNRLPGTDECRRAAAAVIVLWSIAAAFSIAVVLLLLSLFIIRLVAQVKSVGVIYPRIPILGSFKNATGFTVHFSFSVLPVGTIPTIYQRPADPPSVEASAAVSDTADERRIET